MKISAAYLTHAGVLITGMLLGGWAVGHFMDAYADRLKAKAVREMTAAKTAWEAQQKASVKITEDNNRAFQNRLSALDKQLADALRVSAPACTPRNVRPSASAPVADDADHRGQPAYADGVDARDFLYYGYDFEYTRGQAIDARAFVDEIYKLNNQ